MPRNAGGFGVLAFAVTIILTVIVASYAVGYILGKMIL
jgi:hypothetical protein